MRKFHVVARVSLVSSCFTHLAAGQVFGPPTLHVAGTLPFRSVIADFDGDGHKDLAVASYGTAEILLYLNNGAGGFPALPIAIPTGTTPQGLAAADFDWDGNVDLAVACPQASLVAIHWNSGGTLSSLSLATTISFPVGSGPGSVAAADVDNDSLPDLLATTGGPPRGLWVFLNPGVGGAWTATQQSPLSTGGDPVSVAVGDLDLDGWCDVALSEHNAQRLTALYGQGGGAFQLGCSVSVPPYPSEVELSDLDGDGILDAVLATGGSSPPSNWITVLRGTGIAGAPCFTPWGTLIAGSIPSSGPGSIELGDVDGNGWMDIASADYFGGTFTIWLHTGTIGPGLPFGAPAVVDADGSPGAPSQVSHVTLADLDGNGSLDVVATLRDLGQVAVHFQACPPATTTLLASIWNTPGSLTLPGSPSLGNTVQFVLDDPFACHGAGAYTMLAIATSTSSIVVPGWGMCPGSPGELLVGLSPTPLMLFGPPWLPQVPASIQVSIPNKQTLCGVRVWVQGALVDSFGPAGIGLTEAYELRIGY